MDNDDLLKIRQTNKYITPRNASRPITPLILSPEIEDECWFISTVGPNPPREDCIALVTQADAQRLHDLIAEQENERLLLIKYILMLEEVILEAQNTLGDVLIEEENA